MGFTYSIRLKLVDPAAYYAAKLAALLFFTWHYNILVLERLTPTEAKPKPGGGEKPAAEDSPPAMPAQLDLPPSAAAKRSTGRSMLDSANGDDSIGDSIGESIGDSGGGGRAATEAPSGGATEGLRERRRRG